MTSSLGLLDFLILIVMGLSIILGYALGFWRSALSVLVWVVAFFVSMFMGPGMAGAFGAYVSSPTMQLWLSYGVLFFVTMMIGMVARMILRVMLMTSRIGGTDRMFGALFGLIRGILIVTIFLWFTLLVGLNQSNFYTSSILGRYFEPLVHFISSEFPNATADITGSASTVKDAANSAAGTVGGVGSGAGPAPAYLGPGYSGGGGGGSGLSLPGAGDLSGAEATAQNWFQKFLAQIHSVL